MTLLRRRIDPKTFVITRKQLAIYLKIDGSSILNWEKWHHVLWVHIRYTEQATAHLYQLCQQRQVYLSSRSSSNY